MAKTKGYKMLGTDWKNLEALLADDGTIVDDHGNICDANGKIILPHYVSSRSLNCLQLSGYVVDGKITDAGKTALSCYYGLADDTRNAALIGKGAARVFHFEDDDNDLKWCAVNEKGEIVDCGRYKHIWVGKYLMEGFDQLEVGDVPQYYIDDAYYFMYAIERIEVLTAVQTA